MLVVMDVSLPTFPCVYPFVHGFGDFEKSADNNSFPAMFDLVSSPASTTLLLQFHASHKLISGICHGPATFSRLVLPGTNTYLLAGHKVTGISNTEIEMLKEASGVEEPFSVEDELRKATYGRYVKAEKPFEGKVVVSKVDGRVVVTGQNPGSGLGLGKAIYEALFDKAYEE